MLPQNQNNKPEKVKNGVIYSEHFSGPLPHPKTLADYDAIVPGAAERILTKFESQTEHRQFLEKQVISGDNFRATLGLWLGFIISMTAILGGVYSALQDHPFLGGSLSFAGLALLVGAFFTSRKGKKDE